MGILLKTKNIKSNNFFKSSRAHLPTTRSKQNSPSNSDVEKQLHAYSPKVTRQKPSKTNFFKSHLCLHERSGVIIDEAGARKSSSGSSGSSSSSESWEKPQGAARSPPGSPVKLFMPDEFQFYTLNNNGQLVMKQMTKQEIQGMIAAGSAGNSQVPVDLGHHQLHNHMTDGVPKVNSINSYYFFLFSS